MSGSAARVSDMHTCPGLEVMDTSKAGMILLN